MGQVYSFIDANGETRLLAEIDPAPGGVFNGGTITEGLTIADPDPAEVQLLVRLPVGTSTDGTTVLIVQGEGVGDPLTLDAYGTLILSADTVDPTNGGGTLILRSSGLGVMHTLAADDGTGAGQAGFFGASPAGQPVVPLTVPTTQNVIDALVTLGLVAQHD